MKQTLSRREKQVVKMLLAEYNQKEIAHLLGLSPNRVCDLRRNIFEKWEVETLVGMVKEGIKRGLLELDQDQ